MNRSIAAIAASIVLAATITTASASRAEDEEKILGWSRSAELSLVATAGNAESETFGLKGSFAKTMKRSRLELGFSALRAESTTTSRTATGPPFTIEETSTTTLTAEHGTASARYDRTVSEHLLWHAGVTWERSEFAGYSRRLTAVGGLSHLWWDRESSRFRTDYGLTWTSQDDLVPNPAIDDTFLGTRLSYDYERRLTSTAELESELVVHHNVDETDDLRADFSNSLAITISDRLALKVGLQAHYDHLPALALVPVVDDTGAPTGETVPFELDELDTVFTTALVVDF